MLARRALLLLRSAALCASALLPGCATTDTGPLTIEPSRYAAAFDAARAVLRERDYVLERTDAQAGIITTSLKTTAGAATPWDQDQTNAGQEAEDLFNRQARAVRVHFVPRGSPGPDAAGLSDVGASPGPIDVSVVAVLHRRQRPGWRPDSTGVALHRHWHDTRSPVPAGAEQVAVIDEDRELAARIRGEIAARLRASPVASAPPHTTASETASP